MRTTFLLILAFLLHFSATGEEVFRRALDPHNDLVLSLSEDEIVAQPSYNIWEQHLPINAVRAAELAVFEQKKQKWNKAEQIQTESVEFIRYDHHGKDDFFGKYFYLVKLRFYTIGRHLTGNPKSLLSSYPINWAVFPDGRCKAI